MYLSSKDWELYVEVFSSSSDKLDDEHVNINIQDLAFDWAVLTHDFFFISTTAL